MTVSNLPFNVFPAEDVHDAQGVWLDRDVINRLVMSPVPIGGEPFRQGREHGHSRFWPLLQDGV
jgi:hypothetical protein